MLPLFWDQFGNAKRAERHGLGLTLDKYHLTADGIASAMERILSDTKYRNPCNVTFLNNKSYDPTIPHRNLTFHYFKSRRKSSQKQGATVALKPKPLCHTVS